MRLFSLSFSSSLVFLTSELSTLWLSYVRVSLNINKDTYAYNGKINVLLKLKQYTQALDTCQQVIYLAPNNVVAYSNKGYILFKLERYSEALAAYEEAIRLNPEEPNLYNSKGEVLSKLERHSEALAAFEQAYVTETLQDFYESMITLLTERATE